MCVCVCARARKPLNANSLFCSCPEEIDSMCFVFSCLSYVGQLNVGEVFASQYRAHVGLSRLGGGGGLVSN